MKRVWVLGIGMSLMGCLGQDGAVDSADPGADDAPVSTENAIAGRVGFGDFAEAAPTMMTVVTTVAEHKASLAMSATERLGVVENVRPVFNPSAVAPAEFRIAGKVQR